MPNRPAGARTGGRPAPLSRGPSSRAPGSRGSSSRGPSGRWPLKRGWTLLLVLLAVLFAALRGVHALATPAEATAVFTDRVVVVGVTGRYLLDDTDRAVIDARPTDVQAGAVSVRPRVVGDCAAAGWLTLGAGRRAGVDGRCTPQVQGGRVADWAGWVAAAAAERGDAHPGTLAASVPGCVAAVGPGAALAAARTDGSLAAYSTPAAFRDAGYRTRCPLTLVDAGGSSDAVVAALARQPDVTLFVTGIGPAAGSSDPGLQVVYRVGTTLPGWLTSTSTRRQGTVTLPDLTRTLIDSQAASGTVPATVADQVDGAPFQVDDADLSAARVQDHLRSVAALSDAALTGYYTLAVGGSLVMALLVVGLLIGRLALPRWVSTLACVMGAAMTLPGVVPWRDSSHPGVLVGLLVAGWGVLLSVLATLLARRLAAPVAVTGAALTVAVLTVDAALGSALEQGSLLNSRPVAGGRWYGFGNVTFSVYATAGLVLAGYLASRLSRSGHRVAGLVAVAVTGLVLVVCEGWPSMGTDFGGVIALTPGVLWLLLVLSGVRLTWARVLSLGGAAVLAVGAISYLDWRRGPDGWSHLGGFVQRIVDGDALDIVSRKAVTAWDSVISPVGIAVVVLGVVAWVLVLRRVLPALAAPVVPGQPSEAFEALRPTALAVLLTAVLGSLLNDGGVYVWLTVSASFFVVVLSLWVERALNDGQLGRVPSRLR